MLFDMHVHIFSEKVAAKALSLLSREFGSPPLTDGTPADTAEKMREWGVDAFTALNIATKPSQQKVVNDWAASVQDGSVFCFGSVHPDAPDAVEELNRIASLGLHGVKLHPDDQDFDVADPKLYPVYETAAALGLPVTFHVGRDPADVRALHSTPAGIAEIARLFPRLTIIAAHMGGAMMYDEAERLLAGKNLYLDTALSRALCPPEQFRRLVDRHGSERILFGSDCPWQSPRDEFEWLERLGLPAKDMDSICWRNAVRLLGIGG